MKNHRILLVFFFYFDIVVVLQVSIIATLASTLYFHSEMARNDMEDAHLYASAIFYGIFTMLINGYSESVLTIFRLPVFFKHRDLLFLPAWAYTVPKAILNTSVSMVEATLWTVITYHISGFASGEERWEGWKCLHLCAKSWLHIFSLTPTRVKYHSLLLFSETLDFLKEKIGEVSLTWNFMYCLLYLSATDSSSNCFYTSGYTWWLLLCSLLWLESVGRWSCLPRQELAHFWSSLCVEDS